MKREIITTADGSTSIHIPEWDEQYHSKHGAIQEAQHVFLKMGLHHFSTLHSPSEIAIMEIGFGTGLNAFLTLLDATTQDQIIKYTGIEAYPVQIDTIRQMNYAKMLNKVSEQDKFTKLHETPWEESTYITESFELHKRKQFFDQIDDQNSFDLIYFDAFGSRVQPELWETAIFRRMYAALKPSGVLVTYAAKGSARRAMQEVGFATERLPGPPGKREMLRATKS